MYIGLHINPRYSWQILMKLEFSRQIFGKFSNIIFHKKNTFNDSPAVSCGQRHTDMAKLIIVFRNFVNAPKNNRTDAQCECMDCITLTQDTVQPQIPFLVR